MVCNLGNDFIQVQSNVHAELSKLWMFEDQFQWGSVQGSVNHWCGCRFQESSGRSDGSHVGANSFLGGNWGMFCHIFTTNKLHLSVILHI